MQGMSQANLDLGIFQETNLKGGVYTRESSRYNVVATEAPIRHCSGFALFYWPSPQYAVEPIQQFGPNVVSFHMVTG